MNALHFNIKTTPQIIYARIAADTTPVFTSGCPGAGYGVAAGPHVTPGMSEDTTPKTQVLMPQRVTTGMPEKGRKHD